jgi:predicted MFS family arabinose efflux permease
LAKPERRGNDPDDAKRTMTSTSASTFRSWNATQVYSLGLLILLNLSNYLDRTIVGILQQPMKMELRLEDWQLGVISGPAFALFYSLSGVPIARLADRINRVRLLAIALAIWSSMTALCGAAANFMHLVLARIGVGAAEGACTPCSHALVSDIFPPRQRGFAMSLLTTSIPIAQLLAPIIGGVVAMNWGWRAAFVVVGLPGVILAAVILFTMKEPREQPGSTHVKSNSSFLADMKLLLANRAFVWLFIASAFMGQSITSTNIFTASYFIRQYDLSLAQVGTIVGVGSGIAGLVGTFLGGLLADRYAGTHGRSYPIVCGIGALLAGVFFTVVYTREFWYLALPFLLLANVSTDMKNGPNVAATQNLAPPHMRATASAILMVAVIVLGSGIGPIVLGTISDAVAAASFPSALGTFAETCVGGRAADGAATEIVTACARASAAGLRGGLMAPCVTFILAGICFILSGRAIRQPLEA